MGLQKLSRHLFGFCKTAIHVIIVEMLLTRLTLWRESACMIDQRKSWTSAQWVPTSFDVDSVELDFDYLFMVINFLVLLAGNFPQFRLSTLAWALSGLLYILLDQNRWMDWAHNFNLDKRLSRLLQAVASSRIHGIISARIVRSSGAIYIVL